VVDRALRARCFKSRLRRHYRHRASERAIHLLRPGASHFMLHP
jgi:hypothetical protein